MNFLGGLGRGSESKLTRINWIGVALHVVYRRDLSSVCLFFFIIDFNDRESDSEMSKFVACTKTGRSIKSDSYVAILKEKLNGLYE